MKLLWLLAGLAIAGASAEVEGSRPFQVDDLLRQESFGAIAFDPTGRFVAFERRGPYASGVRFDLGHHNPDAASRLLLVDLDAPEVARPLMVQQAGDGYLLGPWSPDGRRLTAYRLGMNRWELGVVEVSSGEVYWSGVTPVRMPSAGGVQWRSPSEVIVLSHPDGTFPRELRTVAESATQLPSRWAASRSGAGAWTVIGSGAFREESPLPAPTRILRIDIGSSKVQALVDGPFVALELSPSGRFAAVLERGERLQPSVDRSSQGAWGTATETRRLALLDLDGDAIKYPCPQRDVLETSLSWSPSRDRLLVYTRSPGEAWTAGTFQMIDAVDGKCVTLAGDGFTAALRWRPESVEVVWQGDWPLARGRKVGQSEGRTDWWRLSRSFAENVTAALPADAVVLTSSADGAVVFSGGRIHCIGSTDSASCSEDGEYELVRFPKKIDAIGASLRRDAFLLRNPNFGLRQLNGSLDIALEPGAKPVAFDETRRSLIAVRSLSWGEAVMELRRPHMEPLVISRVNGWLRDVETPCVQTVQHRGPDGQELTSWLFLPESPQSRPALIVRPYLGDNYRSAPVPKVPILGLVGDVRVLTGAGYAVLFPSLPLPMDDREPLRDIAERILHIVDAASMQAPGSFDPDRLVLWGHSYGGYTVLAAIGQTNRFRAAIAMNAPVDLISMYGSFQPAWRVSPEDGIWPSWNAGWLEDSQGRMGAPPWQAAGRYISNSPLFLVESMQTPVMLVHGDQDPITATQSEEMFSALHRLDRDALLVRYWGEGHIVSSPANVRDFYARAFFWIEQHLDAPRVVH